MCLGHVMTQTRDSKWKLQTLATIQQVCGDRAYQKGTQGFANQSIEAIHAWGRTLDLCNKNKLVSRTPRITVKRAEIQYKQGKNIILPGSVIEQETSCYKATEHKNDLR